MRCLIFAIGVGLVPATAPAAHFFADDFESPTHTAGSNPSGWSTGENGTTTLVDVSAADAFTGSQSVLMTDNLSSGNPNINRDFGSNNTSGEFTWAFKSVSATTNSRIDFFPTGGGSKPFDINWTHTSITLRNGSGAAQSTATLTNSPSFDAAEWNLFRLVYDAANTTTQIYVNDDVSPILSNTTFNPVGFGRVQLNVGFSSATGLSGYYDAITSVPEPASAAAMLGALGLLAMRRSRACR